MKQGLIYSGLFGLMVLANWLLGRYIPEAVSMGSNPGVWIDFGFVNGVAHLFLWDAAYFGGAMAPFLFYTLTFLVGWVLFCLAMHRIVTAKTTSINAQ